MVTLNSTVTHFYIYCRFRVCFLDPILLKYHPEFNLSCKTELFTDRCVKSTEHFCDSLLKILPGFLMYIQSEPIKKLECICKSSVAWIKWAKSRNKVIQYLFVFLVTCLSWPQDAKKCAYRQGSCVSIEHNMNKEFKSPIFCNQV